MEIKSPNEVFNLTYLGVTTLAKARLAPPKTQVKTAFYRPAFAGTPRLQPARAIRGAEPTLFLLNAQNSDFVFAFR